MQLAIAVYCYTWSSAISQSIVCPCMCLLVSWSIFYIGLLTPIVIVGQLKDWPIFSINCSADKAAVLALPICRVVTTGVFRILQVDIAVLWGYSPQADDVL